MNALEFKLPLVGLGTCYYEFSKEDGCGTCNIVGDKANVSALGGRDCLSALGPAAVIGHFFARCKTMWPLRFDTMPKIDFLVGIQRRSALSLGGV